jgi:peptidoglycan/LPS O-acetylase OafA/YrhL
LKNQSALISIDILRAAAALGVFFYHQHVGALIAGYTGISLLNWGDNFGAAYAVPLFFLISGYCIHLSNLKYISKRSPLPLKEYYKRRLLRIYPPYLVALVFTVGVNYCTYKNMPSFPDIIFHAFALQGFTVLYFNSINVVLWTISIELAFYLIYPIFYNIRLKYSLNKALLFSLIISGTSILFFSVKGQLLLPDRLNVFNLWFAWCCGAYLADKITFNNADLNNPLFIIIYLVIVCAFLALTFVPNNLPIVHDQLAILLWTAPLVLLINKETWLQSHNNILLRVIAKIGLSSYSLYLLHEPLLVLKNYLSHKFLPAQLQFSGMFTGAMVIPLIAWYSFIYIERPFTVRKNTGMAITQVNG